MIKNFLIPLANEETQKLILNKITNLKKNNSLISGFKASTKIIKNYNKSQSKKNYLFVCSSLATHLDLVSHFPALCETQLIPYIFTPLNDYSCVLFEVEDNDKDILSIINYCAYIDNDGKLINI